jgi:hypothetical protein
VSLAAGLSLATGLIGAAAATPADDYTNAVLRTLAYVRLAEKGDQPSLRSAVQALQPIAAGQPEIRKDLDTAPPALADADARLTSLLQALRGRADVSDPAQAQAELNRILAMPRYLGLNAPPAWWQRALLWVVQQLARLLNLIGAGRLVIPPLAFLLAAAAVIVLILAWLARALGGRVLTSDRGRRQLSAPIPIPVDYFALAERQAHAGDYSGAVRALAAGVAGALSGDRVWTSSPLTVREIYRAAPAPEALSPLLLAFEATVYGHRAADRQAYARALAVAESFRPVAA